MRGANRVGGEEEKRVRAEKCSTTSCTKDRDYGTDGRRIGTRGAQRRGESHRKMGKPLQHPVR